MEQLTQDLKQLPPVHLRLINLSWLLVNENGGIDSDKVLSMSKEIDEAVSEAKAYAEGARVAVSCLTSLGRS